MFKKILLIASIASLAGFSLFSCAGVTAFGDSETHFLSYCDSSCDDGLSCICGVCTVTCDPASTCSELSSAAICLSPQDGDSQCSADGSPSVCEVQCKEKSDCGVLNDKYTCDNGSCRHTPAPENEICELPLEEEQQISCTGHMPVFWHNPETNLCESAYYSGCNATANNFETLDACESTCGENPASAITCQYGKYLFSPGNTFPADDGCNTCTCRDDGEISCTEEGCNVECEEGEEKLDDASCNSCECSGGGWSCTEQDCPICGGEADATCPDDLYCQYEDGCGSDNEPGECLPRPEGCTANDDPVCGCDHKDYSNACEANMLGVAVANGGNCEAK